jgi:hypothetical protein
MTPMSPTTHAIFSSTVVSSVVSCAPGEPAAPGRRGVGGCTRALACSSGRLCCPCSGAHHARSAPRPAMHHPDALPPAPAPQPPVSPSKCRSPRSPASPTRRPSAASALKRAPLAAIPQFYHPAGVPVPEDLKAQFMAKVGAGRQPSATPPRLPSCLRPASCPMQAGGL